MLGLGVSAHLVEHGALRRKDVPIGLVRRVGAFKHLHRLAVIAGLGECAPKGAEHFLVARMFDRKLFQDGDRLRVHAHGAQRLGIAHRHVDVVGIRAILLSVDVDGALSIGSRVIGARNRQRAGGFWALRRLAAGNRCRKSRK